VDIDGEDFQAAIQCRDCRITAKMMNAANLIRFLQADGDLVKRVRRRGFIRD
jgi:hypothetical protein